MPTTGQIATADGFRYQLTGPDLVALGVSMTYEGGTSPASTLWTYAQRLASFRASSMRSIVLGHSQPVNPRWRADGVCCAPEGSHPGERCNDFRVTYHGDDEYCSAAKLRRREEAASITRLEQLPQASRELLARWTAGEVPNPVPRAIDFADATRSRNYLERHPDAYVVKRAGNWYIVERRSRDWPRNFVTVAGMGEGASVGVGAGVLALMAAGLGVGAWAAARARG